MAVEKFWGLRKPPALRLMLMILLFRPSATPLVIGCVAKRSTPSRCRWIVRATFFTGSRRDRPGPPDLQVQRLHLGEGIGVALGQAFFAEQPEVRGLGQGRVAVVAQERPMLLFADRVNGFGSSRA